MNVLKIRNGPNSPWTIIPAVYTIARSYTDLENKPSIEGITVEGDKSFEDYNLSPISNTELENLLK